MDSILLRNVRLGDSTMDVAIEGGYFTQIGPDLTLQTDTVIDGRGKAIIPPFFNAHTHAAMTLLRGYADDMELHTWLTRHIWPLEAKITAQDVYIGTKLACLEMIKSGTVFFNDMYWHLPATARAVEEMGLRAALSSVFIDFNDPETADRRWQECLELHAFSRDLPSRITFALGPHAIYSVSRDSLCRARDFARQHGLLIHLHVSETAKEVEDCQHKHGCRPVRYLDQLGLLGPNLIACHAIWLSQDEMDLLAENRITVVHNPVSNLKLGSGTFAYRALQDRGVRIALGTDGCSSNNNLDMLETMKFASLLAKGSTQDPTVFPAPQAFAAATGNGAAAFGLNSGDIAPGRLADCLLVDLDSPQLTPDHSLVSNLVYSAGGECVNTVICNGRILMRDRRVEGEEEIMAQAREAARRLVRS
ncbi:amidohydrolase [Desulfovermiculus halophilus]|uniref:amidohydrolase n=1 Tax=Desulfovermiculus halophilus TaxID=339722 RepID=UPI0004853F3A|nr:amidohydrolase [Desulfovermiculus halophilus]